MGKGYFESLDFARIGLITAIAVFPQASGAVGQEKDHTETVRSIPCEHLSRENVVFGFGSVLLHEGEAFGVPREAWDDKVALAFKRHIRSCFGDRIPEDEVYTLDYSFYDVWKRSLGPQLAREREERERLERNAEEMRAEIDGLNPSDPPEALLQDISRLEDKLLHASIREQVKSGFRARLSDLRMETEIKLADLERMREEAERTRKAEAKAREMEEKARRAEAALIASSPDKPQEDHSESDAAQMAISAQKTRREAAERDYAEAERRLAAAEKARAVQEEAEAERLAAEREAAEEEAKRVRASNPDCVAADKIRMRLSEPAPNEGPDGTPSVMREIELLYLEQAAGETEKACERARKLEAEFEVWRRHSAECSLDETVPINASLESVRRFKEVELGCW